eukprot:gene10980-3304_t
MARPGATDIRVLDIRRQLSAGELHEDPEALDSGEDDHIDEQDQGMPRAGADVSRNRRTGRNR